jgi:hypothetical protein
MKTALCVLCLLSAGAQGQETSGNSRPNIGSPHHHIQPARRATHANSGSASAHSERTYREAAPTNAEAPLGDTARTLKKKHATAKKARKRFEN